MLFRSNAFEPSLHDLAAAAASRFTPTSVFAHVEPRWLDIYATSPYRGVCPTYASHSPAFSHEYSCCQEHIRHASRAFYRCFSPCCRGRGGHVSLQGTRSPNAADDVIVAVLLVTPAFLLAAVPCGLPRCLSRPAHARDTAATTKRPRIAKLYAVFAGAHCCGKPRHRFSAPRLRQREGGNALCARPPAVGVPTA